MKFKRLSILLTILLAFSTFFSAAAFAEESYKPNLVSLGDSITFGWNLEANNSQPSSKAFPYLIGGGAFNVTNISGGGWTSTNILTSVNDPANESSIQNADLFTLDIGSNDLMQAVGLGEIIKSGQPVDPAVIKPKADAAAVQLGMNLQAIVTKIRTLNQTAPIILYNLYNPFGQSADPFAGFLHSVGEQIIVGVNSTVINRFAEVPGIYIADAYSAFNGNQATYIIPKDIHPTVTGHIALAGAANEILDYLSPEELMVDLTPSTTEETTGPITIEVSTNAEEVVWMQWLPGEKNEEDFFLEEGNDIVDNKFEVTENGTYTVFVFDRNERAAVQTITISNIKKQDPPTENPKPTPTPTTPTKPTAPTAGTGHPLPNTASPMFNYLLVGSTILFAGLLVMKLQNRLSEEV